MGGGLVTLPSDKHVESLAQGRLYATELYGADFFKRGSMAHVRGFGQRGAAVDAGSVWKEQRSGTTTQVSNVTSASSASVGQVMIHGSQFVAPSSKSIASVAICLKALKNCTASAVVKFYTDSAGAIGTLVGTASAAKPIAPFGTSPPLSVGYYSTFNFPTPPSLTSGTTYWMVLEATITTIEDSHGYGGPPVDSLVFQATRYASGSNAVVYSQTTGSTPPTPTYLSNSELRYAIFATTPSMQALWDIRFETAGALYQYYGALLNGSLYAGSPNTVDAGGSWGTAIATGLAAGADYLGDMKMLHNLAFFCDYAQHTQRAWDGIDGSGRGATYGNPTRAQSTMKHGYRCTFSRALSAGATASGRAWDRTGVVSVMAVTALTSGGYRTTFYDVTLTATNKDILISSLTASENYDQFYFDIGATATSWFITKPATSSAGQIYYKVPTAGMSIANPTANSTTAFTIYPSSDAQLEAENTLDREFSTQQGYFTLQVDTPSFKGMDVFQNMLCGWGDPNNPSRVWISEQGAPQVFTTYGSTLGNFLDIAPEDGEIVTGLKAIGEALFVTKQHSIYRVDFTGDTNDPFHWEEVKGGLGTQSHWSLEQVPEGLYFISELGPSVCTGSYSRLIDAASNIRNLFDAGDPLSFKQTGLSYAVSCKDSTRGVVYTTISSHDSSLRDTVLGYDYINQQFQKVSGLNANVIATIGNASGFPSLWYGDYQGWAYAQLGDSDDCTVQSSDGQYSIAIPMRADTPFLSLGDDVSTKSAAYVWLKAVCEYLLDGSNDLFIDVCVNDDDTVIQTIQVLNHDADAQALLARGVSFAVAPMFKTVKFIVRASEYRGTPFVISGLDIDYTDEGSGL
jgi:hypothetical protein